MDFVVNQNLIAQTTSIVQRAASIKDAIPALSGILITAAGNRLVLQANDLDMGIKKVIEPVDVREEGTVLVNAKYFNDLIRYLSNELIGISLDREMSRLKVQYGPSSSFLNLYDPSDFPELPLDKISPLASISQVKLRQFIRKTVFATAVTHFKPVFTGVLFDFSSNMFTMAASDTHRLAIINSQQQIHFDNNHYQYIIPGRTLSDIMRILDDVDQEINIGLVDNHIVFYTPEQDFYCTSRLIEGQYPNYQSVAPTEFINTYLVDSASLAQSLERACLFPIDPKLIQYVRMNFSPDHLVISGFSEKMGEMTEIITDIEAAKDKSVEINFNTRYLLDIVKVLSSETKTIEINISGALSPAVIRNPADDSYTYILVPLRTG